MDKMLFGCIFELAQTWLAEIKFLQGNVGLDVHFMHA